MLAEIDTYYNIPFEYRVEGVQMQRLPNGNGFMTRLTIRPLDEEPEYAAHGGYFYKTRANVFAWRTENGKGTKFLGLFHWKHPHYEFDELKKNLLPKDDNQLILRK